MIFYKYFINTNESSKIAMIIFTICNTISFFCFLSLSVNSYTNILHDQQSEAVFKNIHITEKLLIVLIYSSLVISILCVVPFGYFYSEEVMNEYYNGYSEKRGNKFFTALKYSLIFTITMLVMFTVGIVMTTSNIFKENGVFSIPDYLYNGSYFILSCFSVLGMSLICLSMVSFFFNIKAYGLGYMPLQLIITEKSNESIQKEYKNSEAQIRDRRAYLEEKLKRKGELSHREQLKLETLHAKEK